MSEKILILDSGVGGLTVFREIRQRRPGAHVIYVADDARFPYGGMEDGALSDALVALVGDLLAVHDPDLVVLACNTASTIALPALRSRFTLPFVGTVPAIKPACADSRTRRVSVLGTPGTVNREYTQKLIDDFAGDCQVTLIGAEHLAAFAEAELSGTPVPDAQILSEIAPCFVNDGPEDATGYGPADGPVDSSRDGAGSGPDGGSGEDGAGRRTDTIVLACTHYPLLVHRYRAVQPWPVTYVDPAPAIARRVDNLLGVASNKAPPGEATLIWTSGRSTPNLLLQQESLPAF